MILVFYLLSNSTFEVILGLSVLLLHSIHLVQIHGFRLIIEFMALILLLLYVFDYYLSIFFCILLINFVFMIPIIKELSILHVIFNFSYLNQH
jgi:hypothetical protein